MNKCLIGLVCGLICSLVAAEDAVVQQTGGNMFTNKDVTVTMPEGERVHNITMGCKASGCFYTIVSVSAKTTSHPCTYILRTFSIRDGEMISENRVVER